MIDPAKVPLHKDDILRHRSNPTLVRNFILGLPEGLSLFYLCTVVLGCDDFDPFVHGTLCDFLVNPVYGRFRDALVPRSFFKTTTATIGKNIWLPIRRDRNIKILVAMNTADNSEKRINTIRHHWQNNHLLQQAFPELVPDFKKVRWSNSCAELRRTRQSDEGTYEAIGAGGAVVSRHYDHIDEDDLVYAKKDDMSGQEIMPNRDDIEKAIGWHKLTYSLFADPGKSTLDNIGTRWSPYDLKHWIRTNEKNRFRFFMLKAENDEPNPDWPGHGMPAWPARFGTQILKDIYNSQGSYLYATQYLNESRDPADKVFDLDWLEYFESNEDAPCNMKYLTIVDLASGWEDQTKGKGLANNVILTVGIDEKHHLWLMRYDAGKFNPDQVITYMEAHATQFPETAIRVEEVQYQNSVRFFARKKMEKTGFSYNLAPLAIDNKSGAKDSRIRGIVNVAINHALHVKKSQKLFLTEFELYPNAKTKDVLDCLGHAVKLLRPKPVREEVKIKKLFVLEDILEELGHNKSVNQYPIASPLLESTRLGIWNN